MSTTKKLKSTKLIGTYLICIGIIWGLFGYINILAKISVSPSIYRGGIGRLHVLAQDARDHEFNNIAQKNEFISEYNKLKNLYDNWITIYISPQFHFLNSIFVVTTSILYIFSGIYILRLSKNGIKFLNFGYFGIIIHYIFIYFDMPYYLILTQLKIEKMVRIMVPTYLSPKYEFVLYHAIVVFIILCVIYFILPKYFINRPKIKSQLT